MEQLIRDSIEKWEHPKTLSEIISELPGDQVTSEVERGLDNLIKEREIVSKTISSQGHGVPGNSEDTPCTLYWKPTAKQSEFATPLKPSVVLSTPRSGIRPPSLKSRLPFKSPARIGDSIKKTASDASISHTPSSTKRTPQSSRDPQINNKSMQYSEQLADDLLKLKTQLKEIDGNIEELSACGCREEELKLHIDALHEYNEIKDVGQMLLGKIAELEGTTTTALYKRFGLDLDN